MMELLINQVTYSLPSKAFIIGYSVNQKRQLPAVKEFVVRFIHTLEQTTPDTIASFFGFKTNEVQAVIDSLIEEKLVVWTDEEITLTKHAKDQFVIEDGRLVPRFFVVEDLAETVSFDLHSYNLLYSELRSSPKNPTGIDIPLPPNAFAESTSKAKQAFRDQFYTYREKIKGADLLQDQIELYKINSVSGHYDHILPIDVNFVVDSNAPNQVLVRYDKENMYKWDEKQTLFSAIDKTLIGEKLDTQFQSTNFQVHLNATRDPFVSKFWFNDRLDPAQVLNHYEYKSVWAGNDTRMIVGNLYTEENSKIAHELLDDLNGKRSKFSSPGALWFPSTVYSTWARTRNMLAFVEDLSSRFNRKNKSLKNADIVIMLPCGSKLDATAYEQVFPRSEFNLQACSKLFGSAQTEVLLIPGVLVAVLFHADSFENFSLSLPVGFISTNASRIEYVMQNIKEWANNDVFRNYFERQQFQEGGDLMGKIVLPAMSYVAEQNA